MLDLEAPDSGLRRVVGLQPGDHPPALVAELPRLVELGVVAVADEAAVALQMRQVECQRRAEALARAPAGSAERRRDRGELLPAAGPLGQHAEHHGRRVEPVADRGEVARAAAVEHQPRQRPGEVGRGGERLARSSRRRRLGQHPRDRVEPAVDLRDIGRRPVEAAGEEPRARAADGAVDRREQAAAPLAGQRRGELEVGPRRGVDQHRRAGRLGDGGESGGRSPICVFST